jgi:signal transduction histidine kinase
MSVRLRLALTVLLTGLATAVGVLVAVALAFERVERESTFARANAFVQRVAQQHADLLSQQRQDPQTVAGFLRSLLLFDPGSQLYLLAPDGTVLARTGVTPLPAGFKVNMAPVRQAAQAAAATDGSTVVQRGAAYVMGDDPEYMAQDAVVAAHALREASIRPGADIAGYLYVVCRPPGLPPSRLARLAAHGVGPALAPVLAVILLATLLAAWIIGAVTRPLATLSREVDAAAQAGFEGLLPSLPASAPGPAPRRLDEIGRLHNGFAQLLVRLRAQWDQLRHLDAFRRESVSNLSHDLRSPLTAAVASLETLLQRWPADGSRSREQDADRRLVEVALRNNHSAARLVRSLGDLAVLDEAEFKLRLMRLDLVEVLDDIGTRFGDRARSAGLNLAVELGNGDPLPAQIDVELFERALANLLDNAMRHTAPGGCVTLSAQRVGAGAQGRLRVCVTDTGSGMPADELQRIFDRHHQGAGKPAAERGSHGLGLAIVKRIIELHRGQVGVASALGSGTTVTLEWPVPL